MVWKSQHNEYENILKVNKVVLLVSLVAPTPDLGWSLSCSPLRLQITAVLASKYPSMVPGQELVPLLSVLYQLLAEQKRGERGPYVLRCLREVARCQAHYPERAQVYRPELGRLWGRMWALALRGVSSPQTEALCLDLLSSIIHGGLINMDRELWKLFSGSACKPSLWVSVMNMNFVYTENMSNTFWYFCVCIQ